MHLTQSVRARLIPTKQLLLDEKLLQNLDLFSLEETMCVILVLPPVWIPGALHNTLPRPLTNDVNGQTKLGGKYNG